MNGKKGLAFLGRGRSPGPQAPPDLPFPQQVKSIERFLRRLEFHASKVGGQKAWQAGLGVDNMGKIGLVMSWG